MRARSLLLLALACACGRDAPAASDHVDPAANVDCTLDDRSGRAAAVTLTELDDPIARVVLTDGCPQDFAAVMDKLATKDAEGCAGDMFEARRTTMISELAQLRGVSEGDMEGCTGTPLAVYRGVTQHACGGRPPWGLMLSVAPLATVLDELPGSLEAIAWDPTREQFHFYTLEEGAWRFFGSSRDMLLGRGEQGERRCAACHVGGGLIMKELDTPWLHWEGRITTAGIDALLTQHAALGSRTQGKVIDFRPAGKELEEAIVAGNAAWVRTRVAAQREHATIADLLRPLFCTEEINLRAASDTATSPSATEAEPGAFEVGAELLVDPRLHVPGRIVIPHAAYHAAIASAGQRVESSCGARLVDAQGHAIVDLPFDLAYPHRARIDDQHVQELVRVGILDDDLARAVLGVDFTRPIFSDARCGLLAKVPELPPEQRTAAGIRAALVRALEATEASDVAALELRTNLEQPSRVGARVAAFVRACQSREADAMAHDLVRWVSRLREAARQHPILEFRETLPVDDLRTPGSARLDPQTCTLRMD